MAGKKYFYLRAGFGEPWCRQVSLGAIYTSRHMPQRSMSYCGLMLTSVSCYVGIDAEIEK